MAKHQTTTSPSTTSTAAPASASAAPASAPPKPERKHTITSIVKQLLEAHPSLYSEDTQLGKLLSAEAKRVGLVLEEDTEKKNAARVAGVKNQLKDKPSKTTKTTSAASAAPQIGLTELLSLKAAAKELGGVEALSAEVDRLDKIVSLFGGVEKLKEGLDALKKLAE